MYIQDTWIVKSSGTLMIHFLKIPVVEFTIFSMAEWKSIHVH